MQQWAVVFVWFRKCQCLRSVIVRWPREMLRVLVLFCKLYGGRWRSGGLEGDQSRLLLCFVPLGEDGVHILLLGNAHDITTITMWNWYLKTCADWWRQPATAQVLHHINYSSPTRNTTYKTLKNPFRISIDLQPIDYIIAVECYCDNSAMVDRRMTRPGEGWRWWVEVGSFAVGNGIVLTISDPVILRYYPYLHFSTKRDFDVVEDGCADDDRFLLNMLRFYDLMQVTRTADLVKLKREKNIYIYIIVKT